MQAKSKVTSSPVAKRTPAPAKAPATKNKRKPAKPTVAKVAPVSAKSKQKAADTATPDVAKPHVKLVRDSFTMPRDEFELIAKLKARAVDFKRPAKKSELLRAGLQVLAALPDKQLLDALEALRPLKAGRPKNKH